MEARDSLNVHHIKKEAGACFKPQQIFATVFISKYLYELNIRTFLIYVI